MKNSKLLLVAILILPWLTIPFFGKKALKSYLPAGIFMATFTKALDLYGENKKWWKFYKGIPPFNSMNFFNFGPYLVTSLWMLKMTYGKLATYLISNFILHILFSLFALTYLKQYKIASLQKMTKVQYIAIDLLRALILYGFQYLSELCGGNRNGEMQCSSGNNSVDLTNNQCKGLLPNEK